MKDIIRAKCLISSDVEALINQQIKKEAHSSSIYLSMASWCNRNGYDFSSEYFFKQAEEERVHQARGARSVDAGDSDFVQAVLGENGKDAQQAQEFQYHRRSGFWSALTAKVEEGLAALRWASACSSRAMRLALRSTSSRRRTTSAAKASR